MKASANLDRRRVIVANNDGSRSFALPLKNARKLRRRLDSAIDALEAPDTMEDVIDDVLDRQGTSADIASAVRAYAARHNGSLD